MARPKFILLCFLNLLAGPAVSAWNFVSRTEFQSIVDKNDLSLVAFVAPSTEGSKALESEWTFATAQIPKPLISIDCTTETSLCEENGVISYPAIRLFKGKDRVKRYRGPRQASAIASFINLSALPTISTLDRKTISSFLSTNEPAFIAYLSPEDVYVKSTFATIATRNSGKYAFGIVSDASLAKADNLPFPSIVCYRSDEGEKEILPGKPSINELQRFVETSTEPLIGDMTRRNELKYLKSGKSLIYIFDLTEDERSNFKGVMRPLAKKYQEYLSFVTIDAVEYASLAHALGLSPGAFPALVVQNPILGQVFLYDQTRAITTDSVEAFILDIVQGKIQPNGLKNEGTTHTEL